MTVTLNIIINELRNKIKDLNPKTPTKRRMLVLLKKIEKGS